MKTPKYETICEIPKDSECYEAQLRVSLVEKGLKAAADAYVRDDISLSRYEKISQELITMNDESWVKLFKLSGLGDGSSLRINRLGGRILLQQKMESEVV